MALDDSSRVLHSSYSRRVLGVVFDSSNLLSASKLGVISMKKMFLATSALLLVTAAASAADLPMKAPMLAPAAVYSWTGFYVGGNVGGGGATVAYGDPCFYCSAGNVTNGFFTGGVQAGYNYQFGNGLVGIEADVNWNNINNSFQMGADDSNFMNVRLKADWSGTIRARGGLVMNNTLLYVTGGAAWANVRQNGTEFCNASFNCEGAPLGTVATGITANSSHTLWGAVIGAGVEYAVSPNWTVGGEFLHTMYQHSTANILNPDGTDACGNNFRTNCTISAQLTTDVVRLRLNYKFY
jgi:outer membrane immunogenic protein